MDVCGKPSCTPLYGKSWRRRKKIRETRLDGPSDWKKTMTSKVAFFLPLCSDFCFQKKKMGNLLDRIRNVYHTGTDLQQKLPVLGWETEGTEVWSPPPSLMSAEIAQGPRARTTFQAGGMTVYLKTKTHRTGSGWYMLMKSFMPIYPERLGVNRQPSGQDPSNSGNEETQNHNRQAWKRRRHCLP